MNRIDSHLKKITALESEIQQLKQKIRDDKERMFPDTWVVVEKKTRYRTCNGRSENVSSRFYVKSKDKFGNIMQVYGDPVEGRRTATYLSKFPQMLGILRGICEGRCYAGIQLREQVAALMKEIEKEIDQNG